MTDEDDRWTRFEAWARPKQPALRTKDRHRVANELFEMVGDEVVLRLDVDNLMKRYRDGLLGAQAVLVVKKVGDEIVAWQEHELAERRRRRAPAPRDQEDSDQGEAAQRDADDEDEPEIAASAGSRPPASARAWARKSSQPPAPAVLPPRPPRVPADLIASELAKASR